jgi:tRNA(Ile)-lysidine synthase
MDVLVARIRRTVRRFSLIPAGARVLAAVSGGADSMALLHALRELSDAGDCCLVGLAHLNHALRGDAADEDEAFCRAAAAGLSVAFDCERIDVRALAAGRGLSIEAAGHAARYEFLERAAVRLQAVRVALGHTRDDQAETFLLRLLRGAGPRGLAGIHPQIGLFVRPMLDCSRTQVRQFVRSRGIAFCEDASNLDLAIPRNRVRHDVVPHLLRVSPGLIRVLDREATIAREDAHFLDVAARAAYDLMVRDSGHGVSIDADRLRAEPPAIARRVAALALARLAAGRFIGYEHIDALLDLIRTDDRRPRERHLPGQTARRAGSLVRLMSRPAERGHGTGAVAAAPEKIPWPGTNSSSFSLSIPGRVVSPLGWAVSAERAPWPGDGAGGNVSPDEPVPDVIERVFPRSWAVLDGAAIAGPLLARTWTAGDRFRPLGLGGTKKLQDFFVDRKVPRERRGEVPVVTDAENRIMWLAGHAIAEDFRVTRGTSDVVILKLRYWRNGT